MNLFCFTLEGSTESMYEPAYSRTVRDVRPQCSPALLRRRPEWGGSDPNITSCKSKSAKTRRNNVKSCFVTSTLDKETIDLHRACWVSSEEKRNLSHQRKAHETDTSETSRDGGKTLRPDLETTQTDSMLQVSGAAADAAEPIKARRIKKLQSLVPSPRGAQQSGSPPHCQDVLSDALSSYNPVLTCMGLRRRAKPPSVSSPVPVQSDGASCDPSEVESVWSPLEGPSEPWSPPQCREPGHVSSHERWDCGSALSLPRAAAWDRFENLIQELDRTQPDPCLPHVVRSITDLDLHQHQWSRFGRFDAFAPQQPLTSAQDQDCAKQTDTDGDVKVACDEQKESEEAPCEERTSSQTEDSITIMESRDGEKLTKRRSNSLESLYSSGHSSSSGVTSGSSCSSNRTSLRLDEDVPRHFCGRARVHTDFVPSPYDTDSLRLQVGDVIDIISKPAMGTWTGMLRNKVGFFKFIYVDLMKDESESVESKPGDSGVLEILKRFDLEGYALTLVLHGYQSLDDLAKLRERHLIQLNVTDPEHRLRLLAAVSSLPPPLRSDSQEAVYENVRSGPRDSGCGMTSPDSVSEPRSPSGLRPTEQVTAS